MERPAGIDPLLLDLTRLSLVGMLADAHWAEFPAVRDALEVSDSALSKQVATLERAGHLAVRKGYVGKRPRTWLQLTDGGRDRLRAHVDALRRLAEAGRPTPDRTGPDHTGVDHTGVDHTGVEHTTPERNHP